MRYVVVLMVTLWAAAANATPTLITSGFISSIAQGQISTNIPQLSIGAPLDLFFDQHNGVLPGQTATLGGHIEGLQFTSQNVFVPSTTCIPGTCLPTINLVSPFVMSGALGQSLLLGQGFATGTFTMPGSAWQLTALRYDFTPPVVAPEPTTWALTLIGLMLLWLIRRIQTCKEAM